MFQQMTWHELVAGLVALACVGAIIGLASFGQTIPNAIETLGGIAITWIFGTNVTKPPSA